MHHENYGDWYNRLNGPAARAEGGWADTGTIRRGYELASNYVLHFFDAYLKGDPAGLAFLRKAPESNGAPPGWVEAVSKNAVSPRADINAFIHYVRTHGGWPKAGEALAGIRQSDPGYAISSADLSTLGSTYLDAKRTADAIAVLRVNVVMHPKLADAYDGWRQAYVAADDTANAMATFKESLALDSTHALASIWIAQLTKK